MADHSTYLTKKFDVAADDLFLVCVDTIESIKKSNITKTDAHMGNIEAVVGNRAFGRPWKLKLEVTPIDRVNSSLDVEVFETTLYGNKMILGSNNKSQKEMARFMAELEKRVDRYKLKYG